jgi:hypothetical protein
MLYVFRYAAQFGQKKPKIGSEVRITTDAVKKELDVLFYASHRACVSLQIAKSLELTAMELVEKVKLVPGLVND